MSEVALTEAEERRSGTGVARRPRGGTTVSRRKSTPPPPSPEKSFRWRVLGGLLFLLFLTPFLVVSLAAPEWTGESGAGLARYLDYWLGRAAWMLPVVTMAIALILFEANPVRESHLRSGVPVLFLGLVLLAARLDHQGGLLGDYLDEKLVYPIGPFGAWLAVACCFLAGLALLWQVTPVELLAGLAALGRFLERVLLGFLAATLVFFQVAWRWTQAVLRFIGHRALSAVRRTGGRVKRFWTNRASKSRTRRPAHGSVAEETSRSTRAARERVALFCESEETDGALHEPSASSAEARAIPPPHPVDGCPGCAEPLLDAFSDEDEEPVLGLSESLDPSRPLDSSDLESEVLAPMEEATPDGPDEPSWESAEPGPLPVSEEEDVDGEATVVEAPAVPALSGSTRLGHPSGEGLLEEPNGQLRLFPAPAMQAAPPLRYRLPPLSLLEDGPRNRRVRPVEDKSQLLVDTLESFGVQARVVNVVHGPTVTRYELQPARGVKVSRFTSLTNDIALALAAVSIRIEAPIPGKSAIGIEVPNLNTELVVLKDILGSENFRKGPGLCLGLGKEITGQAQMTDLQKMPHLLVAGTTGSGKSVCINTLILSLIYRFTPRRLQLLMVDPKQVELSIYEGLPHLVGLSGEDSGRILVDPKKAAMALKQVVDLMEARYTLFAKARVRNLKEYNDQAEEFLPWMVVIIDELADLMMVASKTVETSICRLAQKARAAGIHLVVATQRPSTDVITGLIKVNIPSRIAFAVSSGVDSRVILDTSGAENLLGKGDMLFLPVDASEPRRIQGAYVTNEEIQRVVEFWHEQAAPENRIELEVQDAGLEEATGDGDDDNSDDDLVQEALAVVLRCQQASASMLQTELKVGYARARRILMVLERKGYVGPAEGSKPRKILYTGGEVC